MQEGGHGSGGLRGMSIRYEQVGLRREQKYHNEKTTSGAILHLPLF